ncbi:HlyD family efflux transporter periplasmic adaptor subunit [Mesorhizobium sp. BR1-1-16]|uniref:HlyD family secretion protein n=1 Tax=Mesorhizobium sp. BR1-1-16 TaxID=2876653 RepID=UPI001CCBB3BA|nr:HlyD family efflux transporter periplasmic adaptor subunit [Mesorhizobium sp. BR1-1-16]MBZ9936105.1 HlyD family efflux transporter periplasmic adaptor subunit [Mesorhizobium sp. BR1-1-16]
MMRMGVLGPAGRFLGRAATAAALLGFLAGCGNGSASPTVQGYVEGDFVRIGPEAIGRLVSLSVAKGQQVAAGAPLFKLDDRDERAALSQAEAERAAAAANLDDLTSGKRPEEIAVLQAQLDEAEAQQQAAQKTYTRNQALETRAVSSAAALDQARADLDAANARVDAATRNLAVARLPARPDVIDAARQTLSAREAAVAAAKTRLARRAIAAPASGLVDDTLFRVGEMVPAGSPVVSLLPPENRKVVSFLAEPQRAAVHPGDRVTLSCDGCAPGLAATVTRMASSAEFAPPVIYSTASRAKLVYRIEARPEGDALSLAPGQPLDVTLAGVTP